MTGSRYSNSSNSKMQNIISKQNKKGQILLIAVMLLATVITVVMTVAFNSTNEIKLAKLEEDSQRALAAAEAGVDAVIKQSVNSSVSIDSLGQFGTQGISGNAQVVAVSNPTFVTPLLQKDEQYTFYLSNYPSLTPAGLDGLDIYFYSENGQCPSIEIAVITNANTIERYAYNTCGGNTIANAMTETPAQTTIDATVFQARTPTPLTVTNGVAVFVKVLKGRSKIGFQGYQGGFSHALPAQGKTIESEARTQSGVVKRVQLFQSYPQVPSNFLMTSF